MPNKLLDKNFSTTRLVITDKPYVINNHNNKESILFLQKDSGRKGEGGLRTQGYFKKSYKNKPLISIVTVVFNGEEYIEETIESIINQNYENVEYIIIDGGSGDGTVDIIKKYEDRIDYWVSEEDNGIYSAMNKGIDLVTGKWINFMNAGDLFYSGSTLKNIFHRKNYNKYKILYGDTEFRYPSFNKTQKALNNLNILWKGMCFTHQSTFSNTIFHKNNKFINNMRIGADFDYLYGSYINNVRFLYLGKIISIMDAGNGISFIDRESSIKDRFRVVSKYNNSLKVKLYYKYLIITNRVKILIKKILPNNFVVYIQKKSS